ncbi:uncharacterized protein C5L36_0B09070 [Pichia kudriavzevii]|uniref:Fluoride export protein 1 n=1 Tax=Pichia kudriavzevii TaxID=4909 RepID=A0A2U9R3D7_PICKU|nr:uncharacterized protein C5L36_0B09070 [Pichia kudriavzevii]AWU75666.1 hypothetical protein C5L36_0B09070 [Pichia kudriavzevii]
MRAPPSWDRISEVLSICTFAMLGTLARVSFQDLTGYSDAYINYPRGTSIWINFTACFMIAFFNNVPALWDTILEDSDKKTIKELPLYLGLTSGFCGSFSTFSGAIVEIFFATIGRPAPNNGYRVMDFFAALIISFALPSYGYVLGLHFAKLSNHYILTNSTPMFTYKNSIRLRFLFNVLGFAAFIANIVLSAKLNVNYWYKSSYSLSLLIAIPGALTRYYLSLLNPKFPKFPIGTWLANIVGTLLVSVFELLLGGLNREGKLIISNHVHRFAVNAFILGFTGALSTMSTFIHEVHNLNKPHLQHIYFWGTFAPSLAIIIVIVGSYAWTEGMQI